MTIVEQGIGKANYSHLPRAVDGLLSAVAAHTLYIPQHLLTRQPGKFVLDWYQRKTDKKLDFTHLEVDEFFSRHLTNFDPDYREKIARDRERNPNPIFLLDGLDVKLLKRYAKTGDVIAMVESIFAKINPEWRLPHRMLYKALGGDSNPFEAYSLTQAFNGLMHVWHPLKLPLWTIGCMIVTPDQIGQSLMVLTVGWTVPFALLGVTVGTRKMVAQNKAAHVQSVF